jgi:hypothetical protein
MLVTAAPPAVDTFQTFDQLFLTQAMVLHQAHDPSRFLQTLGKF